MMTPMPLRKNKTTYDRFGKGGGCGNGSNFWLNVLKIIIVAICIVVTIYSLIPVRGSVTTTVTNYFFSPNQDTVSIEYCIANESNKISSNNSVEFQVVGVETGTIYGRKTIPIQNLFFREKNEGSTNIDITPTPIYEQVSVRGDFNGYYTKRLFFMIV